MQITFEGWDELRAGLPSSVSDRRLATAIATALTRTAVYTRGQLQDELRRVMDRPAEYTVRQMRYLPAKPDRLTAAVGFDIEAIQDAQGNVLRYQQTGQGKTPAGAYMGVEARGGTRQQKRYELALMNAGLLPAGWVTTPGQGANLDANGNVSRGQIQQVLSQLRAQTSAGYSSNLNALAKRRRQGDKLGKKANAELNKAIKSVERAGGRFFVVVPGTPAARNTQPGIYQREFAGRTVTPVLIYVQRASYRPRYQFDEIASRVSTERLPMELTRAIDETVSKMLNSKGGKK